MSDSDKEVFDREGYLVARGVFGAGDVGELPVALMVERLELLERRSGGYAASWRSICNAARMPPSTC